MKIYTKTGDKGQTSLVGGARISKASLRLDAYGTIDELNAFIGLLIEEIREAEDRNVLDSIQNLLFTVGSYLATDPATASGQAICSLEERDILVLEQEMDRMSESLPPLKSFILPGGCKSAALAHVCRTVARRAERIICHLAESSEVDPMIIRYVNRLSDYFFVLARKECYLYNKIEKIWQRTCK